jgi:hypothetical protein
MKMFKLTPRRSAYTIMLCAATIFGATLLTKEQPKLAEIKKANTSIDKKVPHSKNKLTLTTQKKIPLVKINNINEPKNPFFEKETKARLIQIADSFSEDIKYPSYSKPIRNNHELKKYIPNQSIASSVALSSKQDNSPRMSIKSSKHQYFKGETIDSLASIEGLNTDKSVSVSARLVKSGQIISRAQGIKSEKNPHSFTISFGSEQTSEQHESGLLRVIAKFKVNNQSYEIGTPVNYVNIVASIDHIGAAQVTESFLDIPVYITTSQLGFHQISANLYNATTGEALLHLSAEKELLSDRDFISLKAHISALKAMKHEGPYELKDLSLTRMPSRPNFTTEYGNIPQSSFIVTGFPFTDYEDVPYVDEQAKGRLEFLTQLGENNN